MADDDINEPSMEIDGSHERQPALKTTDHPYVDRSLSN
jgi:hypothetical protein